MSEKNSNACVTYEAQGKTITLTPTQVRAELVRGRSSAVTDTEVWLFMRLCEAQHLNPFLNEAYLIKYDSTQPAQDVIGYNAYMRRAEETPGYLYTESGIVAATEKGDIVHLEGACLYPNYKLIGGWARVHRLKSGIDVPTYNEVALAEYDKRKSSWITMPCSMIRKVAISQALRQAFPSDFEGLYTDAEMQPAPQTVIETRMVYNTPENPDIAVEAKPAQDNGEGENTAQTPAQRLKEVLIAENIDIDTFKDYMAGISKKYDNLDGLAITEFPDDAATWALRHMDKVRAYCGSADMEDDGDDGK